MTLAKAHLWERRHPPRERTPVVVRAQDAGGVRPGDEYRWYARGPAQLVPPAGGPTVELVFPAAGTWTVGVEVVRGQALVASGSLTFEVRPDPSRRDVEGHARRLRRASLLLSGLAVVVASLTGLLALWVNKPFGTPGDYILAMLWGFGIDSSIRGLSGVVAKMRGAPGP